MSCEKRFTSPNASTSMSARPGRIIKTSSKSPFERPRTLDMTFKADFVDLVHDLSPPHQSAEHAA